MEERNVPSQIENIFMLFDGWLSKRTTRRLADRQQSCHVSMKGTYRHVHKKLVKRSQRFFGRRASDEQLEELEDRLALLAIGETDGKDLPPHWRRGPQCFQLDFSRLWTLPACLPENTIEQEAACYYALRSQPVHPLFGFSTFKWIMPTSSPPAVAIRHLEFGDRATTTSTLRDGSSLSVKHSSPLRPAPRLPAMVPVTPPLSAVKKTSKKWKNTQEECSHYTDSWWVRINALNDCENCEVEWEFLYECPECGFQTCPKCKDDFQPPKLAKGYESDREGVSRKMGGRYGDRGRGARRVY